jgi:serine/threonine protein kinase
MRLADGTTRECDLCYTMCGTPEFLAPEYVLSKGYDKSADWWALGCVVYEMLFGENPFEADDLKQTFTRICNIGMGIKPLPISLSFEDNYPTTANFIVGLLTRQDKRLGNQGGGNAVQSHDFFNDLDWDCLIRKEIPPPFTPSAVKDRFAGVEGAVNFYPGKVPPIFDGPQEWCEPWCS